MTTAGRSSLNREYRTLTFSGDVNISRYPEFREAFMGLAHANPVLIDLTEVTSVDSTFLSEMLLFKRRRQGRVVILIPRSGAVAKIFDLVNMDERIGVYTERESAIDGLFAEPPANEST
jgi:anti-anti-sigma factor